MARRELDTRETLRVVTDNRMITARGVVTMSVKARKLLYIAIAQCRLTDKDFFEYVVSAKEFCKLMDIDESNIYRKVKKDKKGKKKKGDGKQIEEELLSSSIEIRENEDSDDYEHYNLFSYCKYINQEFHFKLNSDMTPFLLDLKGNFTKPYLNDFLRMRSQYAMSVWNLMQREMRSRKPGIYEIIEFDLSMDEIRECTETKDRYKQIGEFKKNVLDRSIREIRENCGVVITYTNIKSGRSITGFRFTAMSEYHLERTDASKIAPEKRAEVERKAREFRAKEAQRSKENV